MKAFYWILILGIVISSCTPEPSGKIIKPLELSNHDFSVRVNWSILLSPDGKYLIDQVDGVDFYKGRIYVNDWGARTVDIYKKDGIHVKTIKKGKGPGELSRSCGIGFTETELIVTDSPYFKFYSLDGEYRSQKKMPPMFFAYEIDGLPNGNYLTHGMSPDISQKLDSDFLSNKLYYFHVLDSTLTKEVTPLVPLYGEYGGVESDKASSFYDDHYLIAEVFENHLLVFDGETVIDRYTIDFGKLTFTKEDLEGDKWAYFTMLGEGTRLGHIDKLFETKDFISFRYQSKGKGSGLSRHQIIYSKRKNKSADFRDLLALSGIPDIEIVECTEREFICLLEPGNYSPEQLNEFKKQGIIGSEVTIESNPVLLTIEVKD
jgi:hypothetical protein